VPVSAGGEDNNRISRSPGEEPRPIRLRRTSALVLAAAAAALALLSVSVALLSHGHGLETLVAGAQKLAVPPPRLYRIVGCSSNGLAAHREGGARAAARRQVAIGFDDGPWTETGRFVTMLERSHAQATFFMIGRQLTGADRSLLLRELRDGDVLGDHTFSHPDLTQSSEVRSQLERTIAVIRSLSGYTPCVFRPPYGAYDTSVLRTARSLGLSTVLWNVDPADWARPGTAAIEQRVLAQVRPGSIIISHDGGGARDQTLAAYPTIIRKLHERGYRIVPVTEMLGYRSVYEPCVKLCDGLGVPRAQVPRGAILQRAP
jgi:peptidoglycan-N-acetylglucosamine deacetylase